MTTTRLPCYCASLRQATRALSQRYDAALRPANLTISQFTLLTALKHAPSVRVNDLVDALAMNQTTLSRNLKLLERDGLIAPKPGEDRRESRWALTSAGRARLRRAHPLWRAAQKSVESQIGAEDMRRLMGAAFRATRKLLA